MRCCPALAVSLGARFGETQVLGFLHAPGLAMASCSHGASGSADWEKKDLEDMMERLGLPETYFDDVVFEQEDQPAPEATRWLVMLKLHIQKEYGES